jgi:hypothetical protein
VADDLAPVKCHPFYYELAEVFFHLWNEPIFISKEQVQAMFSLHIPIERCVWKVIHAIKTWFLGQKSSHTRLSTKLWKLA